MDVAAVVTIGMIYLVLISGAVAFFTVIFAHLVDLVKTWLATRPNAADVWDEAYRQGAEDERKAIEWDIPEYPTANRSNPYRKKK